MSFSPVNLLQLSAALALMHFLGACSTLPPTERRIAQDPALFEALPKSHQELVVQGRVKEGMSMDAVYLAWGKADEVSLSSRKGKELETWIYLGRQAVRRRTVGIGYGFGGYGYCSGYGYGGPVYGVDYDYDYREYVLGRVEFDKGKVVYWEWNHRR